MSVGAQVFHDLDDTIEALVLAELPKSLAEQVTITFAPPDDRLLTSDINLPALDFFLYDIKENPELRTNDLHVDRDIDGTGTRRLPLKYVDCFYLITAWSAAEPGAQPERDEHRLLGEVMEVLIRHRVIPRAALKGRLREQPNPVRSLVLRSDRLQSLGEFWQALGGRPRPFLSYTLTLSVDRGREPVRDLVNQ